MLKRTLDFSLSLFGLILLSPIFLLIALVIWLEDRGSILFVQQRVGLHKKPFHVIKFRTFKAGKITRCGEWLRERGLDELPQLINVLIGTMSIVGPRPLLEEDLTRLKWNSSYYDCRWSIKPGLTGLAQIHSGRSARWSWFYERIYINKQSFLLDLYIIAITIMVNLYGKSVVRKHLRGDTKVEYNWRSWVAVFEKRKNRDLPNLKTAPELSDVPRSVVKSLAIFQLGESGGGTIVTQVKRSRLKTIDKYFHRAITLFVLEENRHAEILARCVKSLGGDTIKNNWTEQLFIFSRRLMGIRLKITVLLAAEVVGICYYRLIASRLPASGVRDCLHQLATDEQSHLQFHCEFLRKQAHNQTLRLLFKIAWYCIISAAMLVVIIDHQKAMRDLKIPFKLMLRRWIEHIKLVDNFVTHKAPDLKRLVEIDIHIL